MRDILILSFRNLKAYKKFYIKFIIVLVCLVFLITLFCAASIALTDKQKELKNQSISANYFTSNQLIYTNNVVESHSQRRFKKYVAFQDEMNYLPMGSVQLYLDNQQFKCLDYNSEFSIYSVDSQNIFSKNDYKELGLRFGQDSFVKGNLPKNKNEILISEQALQMYGISADVLGSTIKIDTKFGQDGERVVVEFVIVGIITKNFYKLSALETRSAFAPTIICHKDNELFNNLFNIKDVYLYDFDNWVSEETIEYFYLYNANYIGFFVQDDLQALDSSKQVANMIFLIIGVTLLIGIILIIYLLINKFVQLFSRNCGILISNGISRSKLYQLLFLQLLWVCLIATLIGMLLTIGVGMLLTNIVKQVYYIQITISVATIFALCGIGVLCVFMLVGVFYGYSLMKIRNKSAKDFLT